MILSKPKTRARALLLLILLLVLASVAVVACDSSKPPRGRQSIEKSQSAIGSCGDASPILVVTDTVGSDNALNFGQFFVSEILRTEGLMEFSESELTELDGTCLATHRVVILPSLVLSSSQATLFSDYVDGGGFLIGLRPDQQLANVFNVTAEAGHFCGYDGYEDAGAVNAPQQTVCEDAGSLVPGTASECTDDTLPVGKSCAWGMTTWVALDTTHPVASGLESRTMKLHGAVKKYSLGSGTQQIGTVYSDAATPTVFPAVTYYAHGGGGRAAMFAYDLAESLVTTRQGNPWLAGPNVTVDGGRNRAAQMFRDERVSPTASWNETREGTGSNDRNTIPQADEQMHVLTNLVLWGSSTPLPRLWYHENAKRTILSLSSDGCGTLPPLSSMRSEVHAHGGRMALYSFPFFTSSTVPESWQTTDSDEVSIHFSNPDCPTTQIAYATMLAGVASTQTSFRDHYSITPKTSRNHCLSWASTSDAGALDPVAQARIFALSTIELDTSYSGYPNTFGYMTGSALPMHFLDSCGNSRVTGVYQLATQFEDDVQTTVGGTDSLRWHVPSQTIKYHQALSDGFARYHGVINPLFHAAHWASISASGIPLLDHARATGTPVVPPLRVNTSWAARRSVRFDDVAYSSDTLTFTLVDGNAGQTLLIPARALGKALLTVTLDSTPASLAIEELQGLSYGRIVLPSSGSIAVSASYTAAHSLSGTVGPSAAPSTSVNLTGYATADSSLMVNRTVKPDTSGDYHFESLWPGSYVVSALSDSYVFTPSSQVVSITSSGVTQNFTASSGARALGAGYSLLGDQVPAADPASGSSLWPCYELGMRFKPNVDGVVTHLKFWKTAGPPADTGLPHTATLWDASTQARLASVTWTSGEESTEGWQQKALPGPIAVTANSTYVVSANCNLNYVYTWHGFDTPVVNRSLASDTSTAAGVYSTGGFPSTSYNNSNYFRDVVFVPRNTAVFTNQAPSATNGSGNYELGMKFTLDVDGTVRAIRYWRAPGEATSAHTGRIWSTAGTQLASVSFANETACPTVYTSGCWQQQELATPLVLAAGTYVVSVNTASSKYVYTTSGLASAIDNGVIHGVGGSNGVYNTTPGSFPSTTYSNTNYFRDVIFEPGKSQTLFSSSTTPTGSYSDASYELGTILYSDVPGYITAIRFYKSASFDGGVHVGKIWSPYGQILATALFQNETPSGWQQQTLAVPLLISANVQYVVSVNTGHDGRTICASAGDCSAGSGVCTEGVCAPKYGYGATPSFFSSQLSSGHLFSAASAAGVYGDIGTFPTTTYNNTSYLRDVVFAPN